MTQKEIIEYNERCAEFLGYVNTTPSDKDFNIYQNKEGKMLETMSMQFHSDWNWIMEVVEAIENQLEGTRPFKYGKLDSLDFSIGNKSVKVRASFWTNPNTVDGNYWSFFKYNKKFDKITKKEAVVEAINQFLIWYNEQRT